jgi:hypothetical protein
MLAIIWLFSSLNDSLYLLPVLEKWSEAQERSLKDNLSTAWCIPRISTGGQAYLLVLSSCRTPTPARLNSRLNATSAPWWVGLSECSFAFQYTFPPHWLYICVSLSDAYHVSGCNVFGLWVSAQDSVPTLVLNESRSWTCIVLYYRQPTLPDTGLLVSQNPTKITW